MQAWHSSFVPRHARIAVMLSVLIGSAVVQPQPYRCTSGFSTYFSDRPCSGPSSTTTAVRRRTLPGYEAGPFRATRCVLTRPWRAQGSGAHYVPRLRVCLHQRGHSHESGSRRFGTTRCAASRTSTA